jgi:N-glycosylase/DNA lyase
MIIYQDIQRITKMVDNLCKQYGKFLCRVGDHDLHQFPEVSTLTSSEAVLRDLGFGYRAKYIMRTSQQILEKQAELDKEMKDADTKSSWLHSLREKNYKDARQELVKLMGVGRKVADCICLFSLDKLDALPVDTHVWKIAQSCILSYLQILR